MSTEIFDLACYLVASSAGADIGVDNECSFPCQQAGNSCASAAKIRLKWLKKMNCRRGPF